MNSSLDALVKNLVKPGRNISTDVLKQRFYNTYQLCDNNEKFKHYFKFNARLSTILSHIFLPCPIFKY